MDTEVGGGVAGPAGSGNEATAYFFVAVCLHCQPVLPQPFADIEERHRWVAAHRRTGHHKFLLMEQE